MLGRKYIMIKIYEKYRLAYIDIEGGGEIAAGFSSRHGGVSSGRLASMNMSFNRGDDLKNVEENYRRLKEVFNIEACDIYINHQVHGDKVRVVREGDLSGYHDELEYDAQITNCVNKALTAIHADCVPVLFYDSENKCIGAAHSGWKGTVLEIAAKTVLAMKDEFNSQPEKLKIWIGPCICKDCFIVRDDAYSQFADNLPWSLKYCKETGANQYIIDMRGIISESLQRSGVLKENINDLRLCTSCNEGLFYSHRRDKGATGGMTGIIALK